MRAVSQSERPPYLLLTKVVDLFNIEVRAGLINSKLTYWHTNLLSHLEAARCYTRLLQTAGTKCPPPNKTSTSFTILPLEVPTEDQIFAAQILTGPFDLRKFRTVASRLGRRKLILDSLARLKAHYPDVVRHALDPQVGGWWEHLADSKSTLLYTACGAVVNDAPVLLPISFYLAMLSLGSVDKHGSPWLAMAVAALIPFAVRLCWAMFLGNANAGR